MDNGETHEMSLARTFPSGAQEWFCPTCGRRFVLQWPPSYKRIILEEGDIEACHSGLSDHFNQEPQTPADPPVEKEDNDNDPYLSLWSDWIDQNLG